jgi:hypothetical protein
MPTAVIVVIVAVVAVLAVLLMRRTAVQTLDGDAAVIEQLRTAGSDVQKPHAVEFFLYFPSEAGALHVAQKLHAMGFVSEVKAAAAGSSLPWLLFATRSMVPRLEELSRLRILLGELATAEQGQYDGWGTPIVPK